MSASYWLRQCQVSIVDGSRTDPTATELSESSTTPTAWSSSVGSSGDEDGSGPGTWQYRVGGSCIRSPTTITCAPRNSAGTASSTGIWLASSKITTSNDVSSGRVSDSDDGLISHTGRIAATSAPGAAEARCRMDL